MPRIFKGLLLALLLLLVVTVGYLSWQWQHPKGVEFAKQVEYAATATQQASALRLTWLGVSTVLISDGETQLLTDPFLTRPPLADVLLNRPLSSNATQISALLTAAGATQLDAMLVGHSHYDHLMDVGAIGLATGARLYGSQSSINVGLGQGLTAIQSQVISPEKPFTIGKFRITFLLSEHAGASGGRPLGHIGPPFPKGAGALDYKLGQAYSILIEHPHGNLLYHGSAGFTPGALANSKADAVLLGVALIDDLDTYLAEVVDAIGAQQIFAVHWDDFTRPLSEPIRPMPLVTNLPKTVAETQRLRPELQINTLPVLRSVYWSAEK